jgi:crossover junction endodeoxyribonuclease RuvC
MIFLGLDPGTATTGYAVIKKLPRGEYEILDYGVIETDKKLSDAERLVILRNDLKELLMHHKPKSAGVEKLYFESNAKTAMTVSQARGVVLVTLAENSVDLHEFTPLQVKSMICGYGKADKKQVQFMVQKTFGLKKLPKPDDAADALAIALCAAEVSK